MDRLLRQSEVLTAVGLSRMAVYKLRKAGGLPGARHPGPGGSPLATVRDRGMDSEPMIATEKRAAVLVTQRPPTTQQPATGYHNVRLLFRRRQRLPNGRQVDMRRPSSGVGEYR